MSKTTPNQSTSRQVGNSANSSGDQLASEKLLYHAVLGDEPQPAFSSRLADDIPRWDKRAAQNISRFRKPSTSSLVTDAASQKSERRRSGRLMEKQDRKIKSQQDEIGKGGRRDSGIALNDFGTHFTDTFYTAHSPSANADAELEALRTRSIEVDNRLRSLQTMLHARRDVLSAFQNAELEEYILRVTGKVTDESGEAGETRAKQAEALTLDAEMEEKWSFLGTQLSDVIDVMEERRRDLETELEELAIKESESIPMP